jgi:hypothetical protein
VACGGPAVRVQARSSSSTIAHSQCHGVAQFTPSGESRSLWKRWRWTGAKAGLLSLKPVRAHRRIMTGEECGARSRLPTRRECAMCRNFIAFGGLHGWRRSEYDVATVPGRHAQNRGWGRISALTKRRYRKTPSCPMPQGRIDPHRRYCCDGTSDQDDILEFLLLAVCLRALPCMATEHSSARTHVRWLISLGSATHCV